MRRTLLAVTGLMATAALAAPVATAQPPTEDSVVASGFEPGEVFLDISVRSGPSGENPTGAVNFHIGGGLGPSYFATVACLAVTGKTAVIGFVGTVSFMGVSNPAAGLIRVTDAGGPGSGQDIFEGPAVLPTPGPPADCSRFPTGSGDRFSVFADPTGDIVVTDAPAFPTSKGQCKHGGWRTYPQFKNQGQCIKFVRHQARQACIFERAAIGRPAFRAKYGEGKHHLHAMRNCVRQRISG